MAGFQDTIEPNSDESAIVVGVDMHSVEAIEQPAVIFSINFILKSEKCVDLKYCFLRQTPDDPHDDIDSNTAPDIPDTTESNPDENGIIVVVDVHNVEPIEQPMVIFFYEFHGEIGEMIDFKYFCFFIRPRTMHTM